MFISELFVVATPLHPLHPRILLRDPLVFPEARRRDERRGRVTLFPISLTSLERAPPLAPPPCPIIPLNHVDKEEIITLDAISKYSIPRGGEKILCFHAYFSRCNRRASVNVDRSDSKLQNYNSLERTLSNTVDKVNLFSNSSTLEGNRAESRSAMRDRDHR